MCRKPHKEDPHDVIQGIARELNAIASFLGYVQHDSDVLTHARPNDFGELLFSMQDRLSAAAEDLTARSRLSGNG